ncbi:MAG: hypothetical protein ACTSQY_03165 [Candidatus Odinarchaeia archaeon]
MAEVDNDEKILSEAIRLVEEAEKEGILLRIIGAAVVRIKAKDFIEIHKSFRKLTDVDYMSYWKYERKVDAFLEKQGYEPLKGAVTPGLFVGRRVYNDKTGQNRAHIDVFFDVLDMCHKIDFKGRLEIDKPTISLTDFVLEKMQIVQINEKDIKDLCIIFAQFPLSEKDDRESINKKYIAKRLSGDWGFWYTFTTNLEKVQKFMKKYTEEGLFKKEHEETVLARTTELREAIDKQKKSFGWKMRARVGTKKLWYNPVGEVERAPHLEEFKTKEEHM